MTEMGFSGGHPFASLVGALLGYPSEELHGHE